MSNNFWNEILSRIKADLPTLIAFLRNPIAGMRHIPPWEWPLLLLAQAALAAASGVLAGIVGRSFTNIIAGLIALPISTAAITFLAAAFFYYVFAIFFKKDVPLIEIYRVLVFANIPVQLLLILEPIIPIVLPVGFAISCLLLAVAFVDNFALPKQQVLRLLGALISIYFIIWIFNVLQNDKAKSAFREKATPESFDILEKEFKKEN